ncbi:MAG: dTMP kinase [Syntrophomonadaceae bacterium]|jgi:dTMP kinase
MDKLGSRGIFISIEGIDGSGKTSLKERLQIYLEQTSGFQVLGIREPGGNIISEKIRELLLDSSNQEMTARTEALLYASARSQLVEKVIVPALNRGLLVLADRYIDSTIAYQGYGRGLDIDFLQQLNHLCTGGVKPVLTLLLDLDEKQAQYRRKKEDQDRLEMEGLMFQEKVRKGYLYLAREEKERIKIIDASQTPHKVLNDALFYINRLW